VPAKECDCFFQPAEATRQFPLNRLFSLSGTSLKIPTIHFYDDFHGTVALQQHSDAIEGKPPDSCWSPSLFRSVPFCLVAYLSESNEQVKI
jgi:hypothetical protein